MRGLPRRAMRMTVVIDELGEGHAVLMVRTDQGDYILDNKTSSILPWDETGYVFIKRESQSGDGLGFARRHHLADHGADHDGEPLDPLKSSRRGQSIPKSCERSSSPK